MSDVIKPNSCAARIEQELQGRIGDLRQLWNAYVSGRPDPELGSLDEYALGFDYVPAGTFDHQDEGYFRYQISWGGPSDEFRFFVNEEFVPIHIEYWFMDWFDAACWILDGEDDSVGRTLWLWLNAHGLVVSAYRQVYS